MCRSNCSLSTPPSPIHTPAIAIFACESQGPDTEKVGDLNKRGKRFSCDVDGVGDAGNLQRGDQKVFLSDPSENLPSCKEKRPKFAIFLPAARFYNIFVLLFGHNSAPQAKIFVSHIKYFQGGYVIRLPRTPKLNVIKKGRTAKKNVMDGMWMGGMGREQLE